MDGWRGCFDDLLQWGLVQVQLQRVGGYRRLVEAVDVHRSKLEMIRPKARKRGDQTARPRIKTDEIHIAKMELIMRRVGGG